MYALRNYHFTVWKFDDFSITHILCEIKVVDFLSFFIIIRGSEFSFL